MLLLLDLLAIQQGQPGLAIQAVLFQSVQAMTFVLYSHPWLGVTAYPLLTVTKALPKSNPYPIKYNFR